MCQAPHRREKLTAEPGQKVVGNNLRLRLSRRSRPGSVKTPSPHGCDEREQMKDVLGANVPAVRGEEGEPGETPSLGSSLPLTTQPLCH